MALGRIMSNLDVADTFEDKLQKRKITTIEYAIY
jgi:hypothetical protein